MDPATTELLLIARRVIDDSHRLAVEFERVRALCERTRDEAAAARGEMLHVHAPAARVQAAVARSVRPG
jgi:hypothetical protein